jgi:hypothetical protein
MELTVAAAAIPASLVQLLRRDFLEIRATAHERGCHLKEVQRAENRGPHAQRSRIVVCRLSRWPGEKILIQAGRFFFFALSDRLESLSAVESISEHLPQRLYQRTEPVRLLQIGLIGPPCAITCATEKYRHIRFQPANLNAHIAARQPG